MVTIVTLVTIVTKPFHYGYHSNSFHELFLLLFKLFLYSFLNFSIYNTYFLAGSSVYPNPSHHQQNALSLFEDERDSLSSLDMTCNALTILQNQAENESSVYQMNSRHPYPTSEYDLKPPGPPSELFWEKNNFQLEYDSGNGSCDLLDSIHDTYKSAHKLGKTKRKPSREHSRLYGPYHIPDKERDFLDVMDSMHRPVSPLEPRSSQNSGKSKKKKLLDSYINKQFYQQKQWLK